MPVRRPTREEKRAATRARLIDAAAEVFAERGFVAASVDDVAERAGLTKGAVYSNFADKEDLFLAVLKEHFGPRMLAVADQVDRGASPGEQARQAGARFMAGFQRERTFYLLALESMAHAARNPRFRAKFAEDQRALLVTITRLIAEHARVAGLALPMPPEELAIVVNALGNGIALEKEIDPAGVPDDLFGRAIALLFGIAGEGAGPEVASGAGAERSRRRPRRSATR